MSIITQIGRALFMGLITGAALWFPAGASAQSTDGRGVAIGVSYWDSELVLDGPEALLVVNCTMSALRQRLLGAQVFFSNPSPNDIMAGRRPMNELKVEVSWKEGFFGDYMTTRLVLNVGGSRVWKSAELKSEFSSEDVCPDIWKQVLRVMKTPWDR